MIISINKMFKNHNLGYKYYVEEKDYKKTWRYKMNRIIGKKAPDFKMNTCLGDGSGFGTASLSDYEGKWLVMFFYPLDFTLV